MSLQRKKITNLTGEIKMKISKRGHTQYYLIMPTDEGEFIKFTVFGGWNPSTKTLSVKKVAKKKEKIKAVKAAPVKETKKSKTVKKIKKILK